MIDHCLGINKDVKWCYDIRYCLFSQSIIGILVALITDGLYFKAMIFIDILHDHGASFLFGKRSHARSTSFSWIFKLYFDIRCVYFILFDPFPRKINTPPQMMMDVQIKSHIYGTIEWMGVLNEYKQRGNRINPHIFPIVVIIPKYSELSKTSPLELYLHCMQIYAKIRH